MKDKEIIDTSVDLKEFATRLVRIYQFACVLFALPLLYALRFMTKRKNRVAVVGVETADLISKYAHALRSIGQDVGTVCYHTNRFYLSRTYDHCLPSSPLLRAAVSPFYFIWLLARFDVFLYVWWMTFVSGGYDFLFIRLLRKKSLLVVCGCDMRHWSKHIPWAHAHGVDSPCEVCPYLRTSACSEAQKREFARLADKYVDVIFNNPDMAGFLDKPFLSAQVPIDLDKYPYGWDHSTKPMILHAPTSPVRKGTQYVLHALERLRADGYDFRFVKLENMPNDQVIETLGESHIVVDQLYSATHGVLALEAMATGNVVVSSARWDVCGLSSELPIVNATTGSVYSVLKHLLDQPDKWEEVALAGRRYIERYHDHRVVGKRLAQIINGLGARSRA